MGRILILDGVSSTLSAQRGGIGVQEGHTVYWYAASLAETKSLPIADKRTYFSSRLPTRLQRPGWLLDPFQLAALIRRWKIDLVHAHYGYQYLLPLAIPRHLPLVVTVMGGDILPDQYYRGRIRPPLTRYLLQRAQVITAKSHYLEQAVLAINPAWKNKLEWITWGIDTNVFRAGLPTDDLRAQHNIPENSIVLFDARLAQPTYRKHLILQAFARVPSDLNAVLMISEYKGDASYIAQLRNIAQTSGVTDRVRFVGSIPHDQMARYLNVAAISIAIPPSDGMPQSLYEAMACGTYPIISDLPQYHEIVEPDVNASVIPSKDDETIIQHLRDAIMRAVNDPALRQRAAVRNRAWIVEHADRDREIERMNAIYRRLLMKPTT